MGINLRVPVGNSFEDLTIFNVYAPSTHGNKIEMVENFCTTVEDNIISISQNNIPIIGGDINARIGNRLSHPLVNDQYFGPWGDSQLNKAGTMVVPMM
jgi:hypothetical protein